MPSNQELTQITSKINEFQEIIKKNIPVVEERRIGGEGWHKVLVYSGQRCDKCGAGATNSLFGSPEERRGYRGKRFCPSCVSYYGESSLKAEVDLLLTQTLLTQTRNDWHNTLTTYQSEIRNEFDNARSFISGKITTLDYEIGSLQNLRSDKNRLEQERNNLITERDNWKREYGIIILDPLLPLLLVSDLLLY
jgi:hypothetical protein